MRPSARSLVCGEHWSGGASQRFAALVSGCALLVKVFSVVHSVLHVDVYRCSGVQDLVSVRDVLIDEGYAELADECYESKVRRPRHGPGGVCPRPSPLFGVPRCPRVKISGAIFTFFEVSWRLTVGAGVLLVSCCQTIFFLFLE